MWALCNMGFYFATCNKKVTDHIDDAADSRYIILILACMYTLVLQLVQCASQTFRNV